MFTKRAKFIFLNLVLLLIITGCQKKENVTDKAKEQQDVFNQHLKEYKRILEVNPNDLEILIALGNVYYDMEKWDNAVDTYLKALAIDSTNVDVRTDMGTAYKRMGMMDLAIREYKKGIAINPRHAKVHYNLGVAYYEKGDYKGCISEWDAFYKNENDPMVRESVKANIERLKNMLEETASLKSITPLTSKD